MDSFRSVHASGHAPPVVSEAYALLAVRAGHHAEALDVLEPLIKAQGADTSPSIRRAAVRCQLALGQYEAAKMALRAIIDEDRNDLAAWFLLARAGIATDDLPKVRLSAANAHRLAPRDPQTLLIRGYALIQDGRYEEAKSSLQRLLRIDQNDVLAHCLMAMASERTSDHARARQHYRRALQLDDQCEWARTALADSGRAHPAG
jgi:tetratricopeptide (TPR) repeat protein